MSKITKDEALKPVLTLALEALNELIPDVHDWYGAKVHRANTAITAIREALMSFQDGAHAPTEREQPAQRRHISYVCPQCHWSLEEQPAQQQGWKLVPVQPTDEMRDAGNAIILDRGALFAAYRAMLNAAPQPAQPAPVAKPHKQQSAERVEPVAWISEVRCVGPEYGKKRYDALPVQSLQPGYYAHTPLYTSPPNVPTARASQSRSDVKPWVGLKADELRVILDGDHTRISLALAIEAKLRERNEHREKNA